MHSKNIGPAAALRRVISAAVLAAVVQPVAQAADAAQAQAQIEALQKRIEQLEEANDRQTDQIAQVKSGVPSWVPNFTWSGDLRYRNETIDQQYVSKNRNRDRIRVRAGFVAKVNDTVKVAVQLSSGEPGAATADGGDPLSSNQTLTRENSRKPVYIDLAYAEWSPNAYLKFTAGKMKYPWLRAGQSTFFDGDANPEGLAVNFTHGGYFGSVFYNILSERFGGGLTNQSGSSAFNTGSNLIGAQLGWKGDAGPGKLTLAAGYFGFHGVQHRSVFWNGTTHNNTTVTSGCYYGATSCLAFGYTLLDGIAEYGLTVAGRPLALHAEYVKNLDAEDDLPATRDGLDTAVSVGALYGKASDPHTWEVGVFWQEMERDALFGQFIDSDFAASNTDGNGWGLKAGYAPAKNWTLYATYYINKTNNDIPFNGGAGIGTVNDRGYNRLMLDLNFKF